LSVLSFLICSNNFFFSVIGIVGVFGCTPAYQRCSVYSESEAYLT
jgi:hypothetical protein